MQYFTRSITPENATDMIKDIINIFEGSPEYRMFITGEAYYIAENIEIKKRKHYYYYPVVNKRGDICGSIVHEDKYKANNRIANGYMKILIDQKLQYLLGNKVNYKTMGDREIIEDGRVTFEKVTNQVSLNKEVASILGNSSDKTLKRIAKNAAKKSIGWAYVFTDEENKFKYKNIRPEEFIPLYDMTNDEELGAGIRYYKVMTVDLDGKMQEVKRAEFWDEKEVTLYQEIAERQEGITGHYRLCNEHDFGYPKGYSNPHTHFVKKTTSNEETTVTDDQSWGRVPFIPLFNNDEELYDLQFVKGTIDIYDKIESDFANNLEDFQDVIAVLEGFDGEDLATFLKQLKEYKAVKSNKDSKIDFKTIDIPHDARKLMLDIANKNIFKFGMGVDIEDLASGNITNVLIKSAYANLDLKADEFETEIRDFLNKLLWFVNRFQDLNNGTRIEDVEITFDRSLIINEVEMLDANSRQMDIPREIRYDNHPWIDDTQKVLDLKKKEQEESIELFDTGEVPEPNMNGGADNGEE